MENGALKGLKIIDLSRVIAGPHCTMILGDLGADIIKIEKKGEGDMSRGYAPYYRGESTYFMTHNRNKKSITLDFRHPKALDILYSLIKNADVLVENFKAGTLEKMGLAPAKLLECNPKLVITRISGFGQDGPYADRPCFDEVAQSLSGLMDITGFPDGDPTMVGTYVCDLTSGLYATIGTLAALLAREHTGKGQVVDISLLDCACGLTHSAIINYYLLGQVTKRNGNQDRASWPATFYPTKDGRLAFIHAGQDPAFAKFCKMLGREDLLSDPEFAHLTGRANHIQECDTLVASWTKEHTLKEILDACEAIGIPCSRVNNIEEMAHDEQLIYRKMIRPVEDSRFGTITASGPVIKMSDTNPDVYCTAPKLGEHNHLIYHQELGFTEEEIKHMEEEGII